MENSIFASSAGPVWTRGAALLDGLGAGGLNLAHEMVDRHVLKEKAGRPVLTWIGPDERARTFTYGELAADSSRFANVLAHMQVESGEVVATILGRIPQLVTVVLGIWKRRAVFCPLFTDFGPEPVRHRIERSGAVALVTTTGLYQRKIAGIRGSLPRLRHVFLVDATTDAPGGVWSLPRRMEAEEPAFTIGRTDPESTAFLLFTSATTGMPKGVLHVHAAGLTHALTAREVLGLQEDEVYWCTADPAWVTGTVYGLIAPLMMGCPFVFDSGAFDGARWMKILSGHKVTVFYTSPTALRQLMALPEKVIGQFDFSHLRRVFSVGESLPASTIAWAKSRWGVPVRDTWWQTETGGIMISVTDASQIHYGSMGHAVCGIEAAVMRKSSSGRWETVSDFNGSGELALRAGWPAMFRGYLGDPKAYESRFVDGWYITGDQVRMDSTGYFRFLGRNDDTVNTAGHMVGPFEVEQVLMAHPQVLEAGVVGVPDPVIGERVHADVLLMPGVAGSNDLKRQLLGYARQRLGTAIAPREIDFVTELPHNSSGKILRNLLRDRQVPGLKK